MEDNNHTAAPDGRLAQSQHRHDHPSSELDYSRSSSPDQSQSALQQQHSSSSLHFADEQDSSQVHSEREYSHDEEEMRRQLGEVESSFLPESGPVDSANAYPGADDTYVNLGSSNHTPPLRSLLGIRTSSQTSVGRGRDNDDGRRQEDDQEETYQREESPGAHHRSSDHESTDSPSAAAAQRNVMRPRMPSALRNEVSARAAENSVPSRSSSKSFQNENASLQRSASSGSGSQTSVWRRSRDDRLNIPGTEAPAASPLKRLGQDYLRQVSHTSVMSGYSDMSGQSESTINADYALQTGGAAPGDSPLSSRRARDLSRLPSFGSVASDMSRDPDNGMPQFNRGFSAISGLGGLSKTRIEEENGGLEPKTPRVPTAQSNHGGVTDTVIAQHVSNIQVPDTIAQDFRLRYNARPASPDKRSVSNAPSTATNATGRGQSTLTLKEQNSKIDKLTKENFDLKLKIHFLDQALQSRSDDSIKDTITKSVTLQTDLAKERRDNASLRRRVRELEKALSDAQDELADLRDNQAEARTAGWEEMEIQIEELRTQLDHAQVRITKLSAENLAKEMERRKMGEYVSAMREKDTREEREEEEVGMWRDLLTEEQGRREMAEEEGRRLREEVAALKRERERWERRSRAGSAASGATDARNGSVSAAVETLRQENVELRRDLGAQTSMLTSRNKERERLQAEIEELKLSQRKGGDRRSLAGDSILDRSASRAARAPSRISGMTGQVSDGEREELERREGLLRDENAQLRLEFQDLERDAVDKMDYIAQLEEDLKGADLDLAAAVEDLRALQKERDEALLALEAKEGDYEKLAEDYKRLEDEAVANIEGLEDGVAQFQASRDKLADDLRLKSGEFAALQNELRSLGTNLVQIESDRETNLQRIEILERELDDTTQELETLERKLGESEQKNHRLEVQSESLQNEITFLREEQEVDKVKIGDLTNALHAAQQAVSDEKEKMQELEASLIEERRQREMIDDQSKQEVQQIINELNSENAKSRDELRKLRRNMSQAENEAETYRSRLEDLEVNLRHALGDVAGSRSTLLQDVEKLQNDLSRTLSDLDSARADLADKERLIKSRDVLLESSGLEARRLGDLLDKERQARKHDAHNFDMAQRGNSTHLRAIANHETRSLELETAVNQAKRRNHHLETQYKEQLQERNALLLSLWNRLSTLCGAEWAQRNSAIGAERTTTLDGIGRNLTHFQRNILSAIKQIESLFSGLKGRIRSAERTMSRDMATITHTLETKTSRLDKLEKATGELTEVNAQLRAAIANSQMSASTSSRSASALSNVLPGSGSNKLTKMHQEEMNRLKGEIKNLKNELKIHRSHPSAEASERIAADPALALGHSRRSSVLGLIPGVKDSTARIGSRDGTTGSSSEGNKLSPAVRAGKFLRHHSEGAVRTLSLGGGVGGTPPNRQSVDMSAFKRASQDMAAAPQRNSIASEQSASGPAPSSLSSSEQRWVHRLRELERRLKAEREARLLDRRGARQRLEERSAENEELRAELEREKGRNGSVSSLGSYAEDYVSQGPVSPNKDEAYEDLATPRPGKEKRLGVSD